VVDMEQFRLSGRGQASGSPVVVNLS
jgi:hypothetical protein